MYSLLQTHHPNAGKSVDLEFFVKDESGDLSDIPGLIRIGILEAPLSVQESIEESKYEPIFDAALGSDRFASIDVIISSIGVTREEALFGDSLFEQQRTIANDLNSTTEAPFAYSAQNEVEYRWDIGSFDIYGHDFESNTKSLVFGFASLNNTAPLCRSILKRFWRMLS